MLERILLLLKTRNLSASQFADEINVQRSGISHILSGRNNPSLDLVMKIIKKFPEIDIEWLLTGKGQMLKLDKPIITPQKEPDLFSIEPIQENKPIQTLVIEHDNIASPIENEQIIEKEVVIDTKVKDGIRNATIEKVLVFYSDRTFKEYIPENN